MDNKSCFKPKVFHYFTNGTGRDTYVDDHNAGFTKQRERASLNPRFNRYEQMKIHHHHKHKYSLFEPKTNHYYSDGSGRDYYVTNDEGGQAAGYVNNIQLTNKAFALRSYQKTTPSTKDDFFHHSQRPYKTNHAAQQVLRQSQVQRDAFLSKPKTQYHYGDSQKLLSLREDPLNKYKK